MQDKRYGIFSLPVIVGALGFFVDVYDLLLFNIVRRSSFSDLGVGKGCGQIVVNTFTFRLLLEKIASNGFLLLNGLSIRTQQHTDTFGQGVDFYRGFLYYTVVGVERMEAGGAPTTTLNQTPLPTRPIKFFLKLVGLL